MALQLIPFYIFREFDDQGRPLAGGSVEFFQAGPTSTHLDTYQDYLGTIPNSNPVILDASGSAVIFLQPALYYVVVRDINGKMIRDLNGIGSAGVGNGSTGTFAIVSNYAALRALTQDYDLIYVLGRSTNLDGGQGFFQQMPSFVADDDGIILVRSTTSYQRQEFNQIDPRWYGVVYNTASDQSVDMVNAITTSPHNH